MPMLTDHEDASRYSAPRDLDPDETTYLLSQILRYVESHCPGPYNQHYSIEEVQQILWEASHFISDEELGIETIS
jgi:hypothetical protein